MLFISDLNVHGSTRCVVEGVFINAKSDRIDAVAVSETKPENFEDARWSPTCEDIEEPLDVYRQLVSE